MPKAGTKIGLPGLTAADRNQADKQAISQIYNEGVNTDSLKTLNSSFKSSPIAESPVIADTSIDYVNRIKALEEKQEQARQEALGNYMEQFHVNDNSINSTLNQSMQDIARKVSPYFKKYEHTDKINEGDINWKALAAEYQALRDSYGEEAANNYLNSEIKDVVGKNQPWYEQACNGFRGMGADVAGSTVSLAGSIKGAVDFMSGEYKNNANYNPDLNGWDQFLNSVIDNDWTRYGNDIVKYGAIDWGWLGLQDNLQAAKESGLSNLEIVTTKEQDDAWISSATPWEALQSGGFTVASMFTGWGEAKLAGWAFKGLKGAATIGKSGSQLMAVRNTLMSIQKAEKAFNTFVLPAMAGTSEGLVEALNTKISIEEDGLQKLNTMMQDQVSENVGKILSSPGVTFTTDRETGRMQYYKDGKPIDIESLYNQEWEKLSPQYEESLRQIDYAASKGGINNFYFNSAINGITMSAFKAGLMAPKVQRGIQDSRLFGWMYPKNRFRITGTPGTADASVEVESMSWGRKAWTFTKEPLGEFTEEYLQTVSDKTSSGGAMHNIDSFINNKYLGDGTAAVGDYMSGDLGAAWTAFTGSLADKETIKSGIMGAISSVMGTPTLPGRASNGRGGRTFGRGYNADGSVESNWDMVKRLTPWRSGAISEYNKYRAEEKALTQDAKVMTEWLRDPANKDKFDGLVGTMNWAMEMGKAARANDEFSYRNSQLGKTINDALLLQKLKGTEFYNSTMNQLSRIANLEKGSEEAQKIIQEMRDNANTAYNENTSDDEILSTLKDNANLMLNTLDGIQTKSEQIDKLFGDVSTDTKQALVFRELMLDDFQKRSKQIDEDLAALNVASSRDPSTQLNKKQREILAQYGTFEKAQRAFYKLQEMQDSLNKDIENIQKRKNLTKNDEDSLKEKKKKLKSINKELKRLDALSTLEDNVSTTLNEQEIMALDPIQRAIMMLKGKEVYYTVTHSGAQQLSAMQQELSDKQTQRRVWIDDNGRVRKGHNKQVKKIDKEIEELKSKIQAATSETRAHYSQEQQEVIDNLFNKLTQQDKNFLDKVIDRGRIEQSINELYDEYRDLYMDRNGFDRYVFRAKQTAADVASKNRAEAINEIGDYAKFASEMDKVFDGSSQREQAIIRQSLTRSQNANYQRYVDERNLVSSLFNQIKEDEAFRDLDSNDQDMFAHTLTYLTDRGIDLNDGDAVVEALSARDENGNLEFQKYVDDVNSVLPELDRTAFTSVGEAINTFNQVMAGYKRDKTEVANNAKPVETTPTTSQQSAPAPQVNPNPGIFGQAATSLEEADRDLQRTAEGQQGTPSTPAQPVTPAPQETQSPIQKAVELAQKVIGNAPTTYSHEVKDLANQELFNIELGEDPTISEYAQAIMTAANRLDANSKTEKEERAAALLRQVAAKVQGLAEKEEAKEEGTGTIGTNTQTQSVFDRLRQQAQQRADAASGRDVTNASLMKTSSFDWLRKNYPDNPVVKYWDAHHVEEFLKENEIDRKNTPVYFMSDGALATEIKQSIEASGGTYTNEDIPLIAIIEHPKGDIKMGNRTFQVIGTLPSSTPRAFTVANNNGTVGRQGISNIQKIRALIDPNNPNSIIADAQGNVITTTIGTINAHAPAHIPAGSPNQSTIELSLRTLPNQERAEIDRLSKPERRENPKYKSLKQRFLSRLSYNSGRNFLEFLMPNLKDGNIAVPVFVTPPSSTIDRNSDRTLAELFQSNDVEATLTANSRLEKAAEVLAKTSKLFPNTADNDVISLEQLPDGTLAPTGEFANLLKGIEAQFNKDMGHHLMLPNRDWSYKITPTDQMIGDRRLFQISLTDGKDINIPLGPITNGEMSRATQFNILKTLFLDENNQFRMSGKWPLIKWQVDYPSGAQTIEDVKGGLARAFDDGILEMSKEGLYYDLESVSINSPFTSGGELRPTTIANPANATPSSPINQPTVAPTGQVQQGETIIDSDTGTVLQGPTPAAPTNQKLERAKEIARQIEGESEHIKLTPDGRNYQDDRNQTLFARVTSIIAADVEAGDRFDPNSGWVTPSTNIGTGIDELTRDFFAGLFEKHELTSIIDGSKSQQWIFSTGGRLSEYYPNATEEQLQKFVDQLQQFKNSLDAQGITIIPRDVVASGTIEVTDKEGNKHSINVAGTLDLLGYDADGNFIIFDMKTNRSAVNDHKKAKYRRQLSLYQKFLENKYGINVKDLRIIPIGVEYPTPVGERDRNGEGTADYSVVPDSNQLLIDGKEFKNANPKLLPIIEGLGYREANVRYENLTEDERALIADLEEAAKAGELPEVPTDVNIQNAEVPTSDEPIVDPTIGLPLGDDFGGMWDNSMFGEHEHVSAGQPKDSRLKNRTDIQTADTLLSILEDNSEFKGIKDLLLDRHNKGAFNLADINVNIVTPSSYFSRAEEVRAKFEKHSAFYNAADNTIYIDSEASFRNGKSDSVIIHEILHALTVNKVRNNKEAREYFDGIRKKYQDKHFNPIYRDGEAHALEEFIADIWSNRQVVENLKSMPAEGRYKGLRNLWEGVKNFVANLIVENQKGSLYNEVSAALDRLIIMPIDARSKSSDKYFASTYSEEELEILSKAPRNSKNRLLAPNGKESKLTERQYVQVRTKAFKQWFGDWENDPKNASKVVDENGEPRVVYRGSRYGLPSYDEYMYFSDTKGDAAIYSKGQFTKGGRLFKHNDGLKKGINSYLQDKLGVPYLNEDYALDILWDYEMNSEPVYEVEEVDGILFPTVVDVEYTGNRVTEDFKNANKVLDVLSHLDTESKELLEIVQLIENTTLSTESSLIRQYDDPDYHRDLDKLNDLLIKYNDLIKSLDTSDDGVVDEAFLNIRNPYTEEINSEDLMSNSSAYRGGHDGAVLMKGGHFLIRRLDQIREAVKEGTIKSTKFTPSRLSWGTFRGFKNSEGHPINLGETMDALSKFYTEEEWNEMTEQEQEHELNCKGSFI